MWSVSVLSEQLLSYVSTVRVKLTATIKTVLSSVSHNELEPEFSANENVGKKIMTQYTCQKN